MRMGLASATGRSLVVGWAVACAVGCAGRFPSPPFSAQPTSALVELREPPPPARVELVPQRPKRLAVWIDGEWQWRRARWAWLPGRWVIPPEGATFSPWVVVRGVDGKLWLAGGTWRDAHGNAVDSPSSLALAVVDSGQVVNASGTIEPTSRNLRTTGRQPAK
jgi:hypothetical protein